jgi:peptide-methionine (S)-S-oxide reductase
MLTKAGYGQVTTEITERTPFYYAEDSDRAPQTTEDPSKTFYFAEDYHQQYLAKVPNGYCPNHATGVKLPDEWAGKIAPLQYID